MRFGALLFFFVASSFGAFAPAGAQTGGSPDVLTQAQDLFGARKYHEAIALLDRYLRQTPTDAVAFVTRGDAKAELNDNDGALADYNAAIRLAPEYAYAYQTRCETRYMLDDDNGALSDCDTAIRLDPTVGRTHLDRADVYFDKDAYTAALADVNEAEKLGFSSAYMYGLRCNTKRLLNDAGGAAPDCARALLLDPKNPEALWASSMLAMWTARYADAIGYLNSYAIADANGVVSAHLWRGRAYNRLGDWTLAVPELDAFLKTYRDSARAHFERGVARANLGDRAGALVDFGDAIRSFSVDGDAADAKMASTYADALRHGLQLPPLGAPQ